MVEPETVETTVASTYTTYEADDAPLNLPVAKDSAEEIIELTPLATARAEVKELTEETHTMHELELHAHRQHALLSSDVLRVIVRDVPDNLSRIQQLDRVIADARAHYPSEDGWIVINLARLKELLGAPEAEAPEVQSGTVGAGSLAEAIALGDIEAAYMLIENRPMLALADAAADFDAVYRKRQGEAVEVSDLLLSILGTRSDEEIVLVVKTLTSALDGTYTTEADAVKVAIMKAVRLLS